MDKVDNDLEKQLNSTLRTVAERIRACVQMQDLQGLYDLAELLDKGLPPLPSKDYPAKGA